MKVQWNHYHENLLKRWSQMAKTYSIMHSLTAQHFSRWEKRLGIPVILLGTIASSSIFGSSDKGWPGMVFVNGGLVLLVTALSGITRFLGTAEKEVKHQTASFKYLSISMNIDTLLSFPRRDRDIGPHEFITQEKLKILEIRDNLPEVKTSVMSYYLNKYDKTLISTKSKVNTSEYSNKRLDFGPPESDSKDSKDSKTPIVITRKPTTRRNFRNKKRSRNKLQISDNSYDFNDDMAIRVTKAGNILASDTSSSDTSSSDTEAYNYQLPEGDEENDIVNTDDHLVIDIKKPRIITVHT